METRLVYLESEVTFILFCLPFILFGFLFIKLGNATNTNGVAMVHKMSKDGRRWIRVAQSQKKKVEQAKQTLEVLGRC